MTTITKKETPILQELLAIRARRLLQIIGFTLAGMMLAWLVSDGMTRHVLLLGVTALLLAGWFAWQHQTLRAAAILLWSLMLMLSVLVWSSGGIHDLAMLGYPGLLVFAATLGSSRLFLSLLAAIVLYCSFITVLTAEGQFAMQIPAVTYAHLIFINVMLLLTGFSVYLLFVDLHRLMLSLREENNRVREREQEIVQLAHQDQLTGLANRRYAGQQFRALCQRATERGQTLAVLFLDLDNFKPVNDSLGHAAGDLLLQQLAGRLQPLTAGDDILCRFGGDEFLWLTLLPEAGADASLQALNQRAGALLEAAAEPFLVMQNQVAISASVGIARVPEHGRTFADICRAADLAMYHAKTCGRNTFSHYQESFSRIRGDQFLLQQQLRDALQKDGFRLFYQPKHRLADGRLYAAEALLRWPQADGSFISPEVFIPLAERSGLMAELGQWVLEQACRDAQQWRQAGFSGIGVAVNISYLQLRDGRLPEQVRASLQQSGLAAAALELELTESSFIHHDDSVQTQLEALHRLGVTLAIDDFGTGYSNLGYLAASAPAV